MAALNRATAVALALAALGVALYALVVEPERVRASAAVEALEQARRDHRAARADLAVLQAHRRRPVAGGDPVAVRARVLEVLQGLPIRSVRLAVRPQPDGVVVQVSGRARQADALLLAERLASGAGLELRDLRLTAGDGDVGVAVVAVAAP